MRRLVVIDDEYIVVEGIKSMIARMNLQYEVVGWAYDGIHGLEVIRNHQPDLVITDIRIPGMDGLSLIEAAKDFCPDTVFVVISGYTEFEYARRALLLGVKDYIDKPISMAKLKEVLDRIEESCFKVRNISLKEQQKQQGYVRLEEALKSGMGDISRGDTEGFHKDAEKSWNYLQEMYSDLQDLKRESYKLLCVFSDILADQKKQVHREVLVSYQELDCINTVDELREYFRQVVSGIGQYIESDHTGSSHRTILQLLDYIREHYREDIGLNELADMVKMNPAYLSALFKDEVGMSYVKYLTDIRLKEAKKLLKEGYKVSEVSSMVGYNNYRYFCDLFKKHVGETPNEYKGGVRKRE